MKNLQFTEQQINELRSVFAGAEYYEQIRAELDTYLKTLPRSLLAQVSEANVRHVSSAAKKLLDDFDEGQLQTSGQSPVVTRPQS